MKDRKLEMAEMAEMNKAFDDFDKACKKAIGACQDFINMDINKTAEPTLETQRDEAADVHTYELWFLGDLVGEPLPKNRASLEALLIEARQMLTDAAAVGGVVGYAEIVHRWGKFGCSDGTVWSMSTDEFKKI